MALQKTKELNTGVSGDYFKIIHIFIDDTKLSARVDLYLDKEARDAGKSALESKIWDFDRSEVADTYTISAHEALYNKLKEDEEFSGATDI